LYPVRQSRAHMKQKPMLRFLILAFLSLVGFTHTTWATHLRAGEITVTRDNCSALTFTIKVTVYIDLTSPVKFGGPEKDGLDVLDFGDGKRKIIPEQPTIPRPDLGENIGIAEFKWRHTYGGQGTYKISYREPNRNPNVVNMINSVETTFYIETEITIDGAVGCNDTPILKIPPVDVGCVGVAFQHNPGAFDPNPQDSLSFELVIPFRDRNQTVAGYEDPNNPSFYSGNYNEGNEDQNGAPTFSINPIDGTITWDAPGSVGEYNIAFIIVEWREVFGKWERIGFVRRDMQIAIKDCDNERPDLIIPNDTCVVAGTTLEAIIFGIDIPNSAGKIDKVKIEAFSEILEPSFIGPATISPNPGVFLPTIPKPAELAFSWKTDSMHIKDQPYQIVFKITDDGSPKLVTFKTWFVKVVAPEPVWKNATVDPAKRHVALSWNDYFDNASTMQVWRRIDSFVYEPANCETGIPESLGYELIGEVDPDTEIFTDTNRGKGLNVGAQYCYRLVALFPLPQGGESYMSDEICIDPILADAPVITHVTVKKTSKTDGEIRISWRSPFEIDPIQFPPPYEYKVWRSETFTGASPLVEVNPGTTNDTTTLDTTIDTKEKVYSYLVELYSPALGSTPVDTSAVASMVQLDIKSKEKQLDLSWSAFVPWSNQSQAYPRHLVYRGLEEGGEAGLILIDSIDVTANGFIYLDSGQYNDTPLEEDKVYCYRVMTLGTYGNPEIDEPLENFSQMACAQPSDDEPPPPTCLPQTKIANLLSCEEYLADKEKCGNNSFANKLIWGRAKPIECGGEILGYRVYISSSTNGEFLPVIFQGGQTITKDTVYEDTGLSSFAKCYKISVVDRSGNESALSEAICNDNCPYYELPNVFTPNGDGCNELFSAYSERSVTGEETSTSLECQPTETLNCARFVKEVKFKVYNRWGQLLYDFESVQGGTSEKTIYIDWDGRDNAGNMLASGVYYYAADVSFNTLDNQEQTIKGWVHLMR
jgi:hypothetical protein